MNERDRKETKIDPKLKCNGGKWETQIVK